MREEKIVMEVIRTENLSKTFRVRKKEKGMKGSLQSIFHPNVEKIRAVAGISFAVNEGEILAFIGPNFTPDTLSQRKSPNRYIQ